VPVVEVAGGCFCCRFPDLHAALTTLRRTVNPEVILAEPVGSCTDLMATVIRPLAHYHAGEYRLAPLTVLIDPTREEERYADSVRYLYQKQLEEAELIVLAKQDLATSDRSRQQRRLLTLQLGEGRVFPLSAQTGEGVAAWLDAVMSAVSTQKSAFDIDYRTYAAGEAALGWLNASGVVTADRPFSAANWLSYLLRMLDDALDRQHATIAHVKAQATTSMMTYKASITQGRGILSWDLHPPDEPATSLQFTLNARVQTTPADLELAVRNVFAELSAPPAFHYSFTQFDCFSPAAPQPTYRL
jgi:G3E family GTPase